MVLQLVAGGVSYEAYPSLAGTDAGVQTFPFVDWRPAPWDTANANRRITDADLKAISQFNIYVNSVDGGAPSGSIVVDDIAALPGVEPPPLFSDVPPGSPNVDSILWLHDQGLDDGYQDGTFRPTKPQTREATASLLYRYSKATFVPTAKRPTFLDVPKKHAVYKEIEWLAHEKLVDKAIPLFLPKAPLDRSSAAELLWRLAGSPEPAAPEAFSDVPSWHPYSQGHRVGDRDRHHRADVGHQVRRAQGGHARRLRRVPRPVRPPAEPAGARRAHATSRTAPRAGGPSVRARRPGPGGR